MTINPCFAPLCGAEAEYEIGHIQTGAMKLACRGHVRLALSRVDPEDRGPHHVPAGRSDLDLEVELRRELAAERDALRAEVERLQVDAKRLSDAITAWQVFAANHRDALSLLLHEAEAMISGRPARSMGKAISAARMALRAEGSKS